ncbi:MAG TPA: ABC transporter permease [Clostridiaceae bacterium]|nr:ABC transporter permease [Clostridiaceae bacterium]
MSIARPSISYAQDAWRRFRQNRVALAGLIFVLIMVLGSIFVPLLSPMPIDQQNLEYTYVKPMTYAPDLNHMFIFGTDNLGRDLWVRTWYGARISLSIGILAALISVLIGVPYGGISGYSGGTVDIIMMRIVEIVSGIPYMILVILFLVVLPRGYLTIVAAMSIVIWTSPARLVRAQVLQLKGQEFILAAKTLGASTGRIISKHLIPNSLGVVVIQMTMTIPSAIFSEAFLSYIGIGIQPPMASWGTLARDGVQIFQLNPWVMFIPATFICLTMLSLNLIGDALRNALDPKLRR